MMAGIIECFASGRRGGPGALIGAAAVLLALGGARSLRAQRTLPAADPATLLMRSIVNWNQKLDTPGLSLRLKRIARPGSPPGTKAETFEVYVTGLPAGEKLTLLEFPITRREPEEAMEGITLNAEGEAICAGTPGTCSSDKPNDPVDLVLIGASGEPMRFALVSADGKYRVADTEVPDPVIGRDHGCRLEALRALPHAELVILRGSGFAPGAKVRLRFDSDGERHGEELTANAQGSFVLGMEPFVKGKTSGTLSGSAKAGTCGPRIAIAWGAGS